MKQFLLIIISAILISFGLALITAKVMEEHNKDYNTRVETHTEVGSISNIYTVSHKIGISIVYEFDLPLGKKEVQSHTPGFKVGDNVTVIWSKRKNGYIVVEGFWLQKN